MKIWLKILVTAIAGGLTYLLTDTTHQPQIWQLTMSVFVGGIVLVVQLLVETAELTRRTADTVAEMNAATALLAQAEDALGKDSLTKLVEAAARIDRRDGAQILFADLQVSRLTDLFEGLRAGRAEYEGIDRDWLLGLTDTATASIDATSMTSFSKSRGFVDEGDFWTSELGRRYLDGQRRAIKRGVRIRRVFLLDAKENPTGEQIEDLLRPHKSIAVETRVLRSDSLDFLLEGNLADFILFDQKISYELQSATRLGVDSPAFVNTVALLVAEKRVHERRTRFEEIWNDARPV